jgi:peptidoglycan/xylan/chitin deacetylase (PgdA/CDA1 family)
MKKSILFIVFCLAAITIFPQPIRREVAITIDDLPVASQIKEIEFQQQVTDDLINKIKNYGVPAIGFVNEGKLYEGDNLFRERVDLLKQWLKAGLELGNHTYSHWSLNKIPANDYTDDLLKGEKITRELMKGAGKELTYFRHPFLHTGRNVETRDSLNKFLKEHNYKVAPVTIDNAEWIFARAYEKAFVDEDTSMMRKIVEAYIPYMESKFEHFEFVSRELFGREVKQVILIHANKINADNFDKLADMIIKRSYKFIPLKKALEDEAYRSPDNFFGAGGISWLHRWALTEGRDKEIFKTDLPAPEFVMKYAGVESE